MIPIVEQGARIRDAVFWSGDDGCIVAGDQEADEQNLAQSLIFVLSEHRQPAFRFLEWIAHTACLLPDDQGALVAGTDGPLLTVSSGSIKEGRIVFADGFEGPFTLRSLRRIGDEAFGVGMSGLIIRRLPDTRWELLQRPRRGLPGLEAIDGFATTELYAVGWNGALLRWENSSFRPCPAPTSVILTGICCAGDGLAYACGQDGVILRGRYAAWEVICPEATRENLWDIAWFKGRSYVSTVLSLYVIDDDDLVPVDFGEDPPTSCYRIFVHDGFLWSIGREDILRFDGLRWVRVA